MSYHFSPEQSLSIEYMQTANALNDAKVAISHNNFTLIGFDQRGLIIPGIKQQQIKQVQQRCKVARIDGMGDVVRSPEHLEHMKNVRRYSKTYNLEILKSSSCQ